MENKKKIAFTAKDLDKFLAQTDLVLQARGMERVNGGGAYSKLITHSNTGTYADALFVNKIMGPIKFDG
jgi:hypothetical protein